MRLKNRIKKKHNLFFLRNSFELLFKIKLNYIDIATKIKKNIKLKIDSLILFNKTEFFPFFHFFIVESTEIRSVTLKKR